MRTGRSRVCVSACVEGCAYHGKDAGHVWSAYGMCVFA